MLSLVHGFPSYGWFLLSRSVVDCCGLILQVTVCLRSTRLRFQSLFVVLPLSTFWVLSWEPESLISSFRFYPLFLSFQLSSLAFYPSKFKTCQIPWRRGLYLGMRNFTGLQLAWQNWIKSQNVLNGFSETNGITCFPLKLWFVVVVLIAWGIVCLWFSTT